MYVDSGQPDRAAALLEEPFLNPTALSPLRQAHLAYSRGLLALSRDDAKGASAQFAESLVLFDTVKAKFSLNVFALVGLSNAERALGRFEAAEAAALQAIALAETFVESGAPSYLVGLSRSSLGEAQLARGQAEAGQASLGEALAHLQQTLGEDHPATRKTRKLAVGSRAAR